MPPAIERDKAWRTVVPNAHGTAWSRMMHR